MLCEITVYAASKTVNVRKHDKRPLIWLHKVENKRGSASPWFLQEINFFLFKYPVLCKFCFVLYQNWIVLKLFGVFFVVSFMHYPSVPEGRRWARGAWRGAKRVLL